MIDRDWLDLKLRTAMFIFNRSMPRDIWPSVLQMWIVALGECDQKAVGERIDICIRNDASNSLTPGAIWRALNSPKNDIEQVILITTEVTGITRRDLIGQRRNRSFAWPRIASMEISARCTGKSLPQVGRAFGGRDHTTVMYARKRAPELCAIDAEFYAYHSEIERRLAE